MERKLFAFDIDGTILDSQKRPLDSTREALEKLRAQGHLVTIATGRSRYMAQEVILDLDFTNYVLCNGAAAFVEHEQYYQNLLDQEALERFTEEFAQRELGLACVGLDEIKRSNLYRSEKVEKAMNSFQFHSPEFDEKFYQEADIYQALAFYDETDEQAFEKGYPQFRFIRWHPYSVDVIPKNGSKAATLLHLADRLNIDRKNVIAFGDGENDREMLSEAGTGIAMGNASQSIQQIADVVTDTNDQDGIWKALKAMNEI
jgi:Cof subfamily protein (haloacid dehalogenase superfamily)